MNLYLLNYFIKLVLLTGCLCIFGGCSPPRPLKIANSFILTNINIVDVKNQQILSKRFVVVKKGKIVDITHKLPSKLSPKIPIYSGNNGYITPGLIDMHVHIFEPASYLMTLSHGVTHVRIMGGVPSQLEWRDRIESGQMLGSTSTVASPIISGFPDAPLHRYVGTELEARQAVRNFHAEGYDLIKAYVGLSQEALIGIIDEAKSLQFPVAKHGPHAAGDMPVSTLIGFQSFEHAEDIYQGPLNYKFAPKRLVSVIDEIKATKVPMTPTLNVFYQLTRISDEKEAFLNTVPLEYTPTIVRLEAKQNQVKRWLDASEDMAAHNKRTMEFLFHVTKQFNQRGVELLVGSDSGALLTPHGLSTHDEIQLMMQAGLSTFEVLRAATLNPAKALKREHDFGSISVGKQADFIYTTTNPIESISTLRNPEAVIKFGYWYDNATLQKLRDSAIASRSIWQEMWTLYQGW